MVIAIVAMRDLNNDVKIIKQNQIEINKQDSIKMSYLNKQINETRFK